MLHNAFILRLLPSKMNAFTFSKSHLSCQSGLTSVIRARAGHAFVYVQNTAHLQQMTG